MIKFFLFLFFYFFSTLLYGLTIEETIKNTVENNSKIKINLEKIKESRELIQKASGELLPDISSTISTTYTTSESRTSTTTTENDTFADTYKLTITKNLYDAGYDKLEIERSKILFNDEILNFQIFLQNLILDAITGYLTVLSYEAALEATKKNFEIVTKVLEETKTKYDIGSATLYDLQNTESSYAMTETNLFLAEQNLLIAKQSFKRIAGINAIDLDSVVNVEKDIIQKNIETNAINNNLSLLLINNSIKDKEILLLKENKTKKPNLDLTGTAQYSDTDRIDTGKETTQGSIALTLTIPIFQQGIDDSNIRKYRSQILQRELSLDDAKNDLLLNIANTFKDFKVSESLINANNISITASKTAINSLEEEYLIGTKSISDILTEEEKLLNFKLNFFDSKKDYLISYFKIRSLEGSLLESFKKYIPDLE